MSNVLPSPHTEGFCNPEIIKLLRVQSQLESHLSFSGALYGNSPMFDLWISFLKQHALSASIPTEYSNSLMFYGFSFARVHLEVRPSGQTRTICRPQYIFLLETFILWLSVADLHYQSEEKSEKNVHLKRNAMYFYVSWTCRL